MIPADQQALIHRLYHGEKWRVGTIARELGLHHSTVTRVLTTGAEPVVTIQRPSLIDPFIPFVHATLGRYPRLAASRLFAMVRERGYSGSVSHFRHQVARLRPKPAAEAYLRLQTLPGEQAQVDWAHFGEIPIGRARRRLVAFVMVLSWSRRLFLRFFVDQRMPSFLRGHVEAFGAFGGVPRVALYDNLKSVVLERQGEAVRFHPTITALARHYCFQPRPAAPARGNEKGRVERAIRYVRESFFAGRRIAGLDRLNAEADAWCRGPASERRCPADPTLTVGEAFEQERPRLLPLPADVFATDERVEAAVGKTPYLRFDLNDYSVPHDHVRRTLTVLASAEAVRIFDRHELVATHPRSYSRGEQIEDPEHVRDLVEVKRLARHARGLDRLAHAVPQTRELIARLAEHGRNLGGATAELLGLLDLYGPRELAAAVREALAYRELPDASGRVRADDRRLAVRLFREQVPLKLVTAAFQLALARRRARPADLPPLGTIRSLHYFLPVIDEARTLDPDYLGYVVQRAQVDSARQRGGCHPR